MASIPLSASAASVLSRCAAIVTRTCLVSKHIAGRPSLASSGCSQGDSELASRPTRRSRATNGFSAFQVRFRIRHHRALQMHRAVSLTTHTAVSSIATSRPQRNSIVRLLRSLTRVEWSLQSPPLASGTAADAQVCCPAWHLPRLRAAIPRRTEVRWRKKLPIVAIGRRLPANSAADGRIAKSDALTPRGPSDFHMSAV